MQSDMVRNMKKFTLSCGREQEQSYSLMWSPYSYVTKSTFIPSVIQLPVGQATMGLEGLIARYCLTMRMMMVMDISHVIQVQVNIFQFVNFL